MKSVALIDDHPVIAVALKLTLRQTGRFELTTVVTKPSQLFNNLGDRIPDSIICDLVFDNEVQFGTIELIRRFTPRARIVVFSSLPQRVYALQAMQAGADAFVNKGDDLSNLIASLEYATTHSIRDMKAHRASGGPARKSAANGFGHVHMTAREAEVARAICEGRTIEMIASRIGISAKTVAVHRDNIRKKFGCRTSTDLRVLLSKMTPLGGDNA